MTWNLLHLARMLKDAGGIPAHGNQRSEWDAGCRFDFDNPVYRDQAPAGRRTRQSSRRPTEIPSRASDDQAVLQIPGSRRAGVEVKPMFGKLGPFVNGNMFAGLFGPGIGVRLDDAGRDELAAVEGSGPFGPGRTPDVWLPCVAGGVAGESRCRGELGRARAGSRAVDAPQGQEAETVRQALARTKTLGIAPLTGSKRIASTIRGAAPSAVSATPHSVKPAAR